MNWKPMLVVAAMGTIPAVAGCLGEGATDLYAPVLEITFPQDGAVVSGVVNFTVNAVDDSGIDVVTFYAGTTKLGEDRIAPYNWLWSTVTASGQVRLKAVAEDLAGNMTSREITVTINNVPE